MSFSGEPCTHSGGPSRCTCVRCLQGYGTDNHNCDNCLACLAALQDNDLMQDGLNFSPPATANPSYHVDPSLTCPPAGPAAGVPGTGPSAFFYANNAAILDDANVNPLGPALPRFPQALPDGVLSTDGYRFGWTDGHGFWWTDGYGFWWTDGCGFWTSRLDEPLLDYGLTASTSPGGPPHDGDNPSQPTVANPASSTVTTPLSSLAATPASSTVITPLSSLAATPASSIVPTPASSSGFSPTSDDPARPFGCPNCDRSFRQRKDLKRHTRTVHSIDGIWRCICGKQQNRKDNHKRHVMKCTRTAVFDHYLCACLNACADVQEHLDHLADCQFGAAPRGRPRAF